LFLQIYIGAHCLAQGKIGSGFDISAACNGHHIYKRFSPEILSPIIDAEYTPELIDKVMNAQWDCVVQRFGFPPLLQLQMGEINGGSNTPKMVSKLLQWRENNLQECENYWKMLDTLQSQLYLLLEDLNILEKEDPVSYAEKINYCSKFTVPTLDPSSSKVAAILVKMFQLYNVFIVD
jgi:phosphomevalonate kinase